MFQYQTSLASSTSSSIGLRAGICRSATILGIRLATDTFLGSFGRTSRTLLGIEVRVGAVVLLLTDPAYGGGVCGIFGFERMPTAVTGTGAGARVTARVSLPTLHRL